ncbi:MAG: ATP/GTP-binding protein [Nitrosotalea sp.]
MKVIFLVGTAGSGKSLLTSKILDYYTRNGHFVGILNLDPGVENLPYTCDVDVRDYVDIVSIMRQYDLGPNGSMIMANDLIASKIDELQREIDNVNPDYLIVDTPGQIELFAYRASGLFFVQNLSAEQKTSIFLHDGSLITTAVNFVSIALLATSVKLRLGLSQVNVITKVDLIEDKIKDMLKWSSNMASLEEAIAKESDGEIYALTSNLLRGMNLGGLAQGLIPISNATGDGMINLHAALSRILNMGEEMEDYG